jgi:hypothetical protein
VILFANIKAVLILIDASVIEAGLTLALNTNFISDGAATWEKAAPFTGKVERA